MARFEMRILADGTIKTEIQDAPGEQCLDHIPTARRLAPGAEVVSSATTADFAAVVDVQQQHQIERVDRHDA